MNDATVVNYRQIDHATIIISEVVELNFTNLNLVKHWKCFKVWERAAMHYTLHRRGEPIHLINQHTLTSSSLAKSSKRKCHIKPRKYTRNEHYTLGGGAEAGLGADCSGLVGVTFRWETGLGLYSDSELFLSELELPSKRKMIGQRLANAYQSKIRQGTKLTS